MLGLSTVTLCYIFFLSEADDDVRGAPLMTSALKRGKHVNEGGLWKASEIGGKNLDIFAEVMYWE